jgi:hypothetical protein
LKIFLKGHFFVIAIVSDYLRTHLKHIVSKSAYFLFSEIYFGTYDFDMGTLRYSFFQNCFTFEVFEKVANNWKKPDYAYDVFLL